MLINRHVSFYLATGRETVTVKYGNVIDVWEEADDAGNLCGSLMLLE